MEYRSAFAELGRRNENHVDIGRECKMKILIAILVFSLIIIIHELGHFLLAKKNGVYVTEFSIGMGPRIVSTVKGETRYSIKLLPFGGSCMMLGEDEDVADDDRAFGKKSVWARISIIAAGPIFNFILAFVISLFVVGMIGYDPAIVNQVDADSAAAAAGLEAGDVITSFAGHKVDVSRDIDMYLQFHPLSQNAFDITYQRDGKSYNTVLTPKMVDQYMLGFSYSPGNEPAAISTLTEDYPLMKAGIMIGDIITAVDGTPIASGTELSSYFSAHRLNQSPVTIAYTRDGEVKEATVTPVYVKSSYSMGASINGGYFKTDFWSVIKYSAVEVKFWIKTTIQSLGQIFKGKVTKDDIAGPVGLVNVIGDAYESSSQYGLKSVFVTICNWVILISANLGVMNLLPIPALDGGRLVFMILEIIRGGKQIPKDKEGMVHMIGLVALMILMVFVMFNDISNLLK